MQPEPTDVPSNEPISPFTQTSSLAQHGFRNDVEPFPDDAPPREDGDDISGQEADADTLSSFSDQSGRGRRLDSRGLSNQLRSSPGSSSGESSGGSPVDRIVRHEKLNLLRKKKSHTIGFHVVPSSERINSATGSISIDQFPNEVITHVLSHLPPSALAAMSLVSRRFHGLVTTPHAWRIAFCRYFPGEDAVEDVEHDWKLEPESQQISRSERRLFCRLSALASWRSEYILRTRLLRSLARGRPAKLHLPTRAGGPRYKPTEQVSSVVTYSSELIYPVSHIHACFGSGLNKRHPMLIHGASESGAATLSDPTIGKVSDIWGPKVDVDTFQFFEDSQFAGDEMWGLGAGHIVGLPNTLDVSRTCGKVYGEGLPGGRVFFTLISDRRGLFLKHDPQQQHDHGIPNVHLSHRSVTCTWIAKSDRVLKMTSGLFGILVGYSNGLLSSFSVGPSPLYDHRFEKGEPTAKWVLSPGVPIVAIQVDDSLSTRRIGGQRVWAVALNALGEVFYLADIPVRPDTRGKLSDEELHTLSWETGRSVEWKIIEPTRRCSKTTSFSDDNMDGFTTSKPLVNKSDDSKENLVMVAQEMEKLMQYRPSQFRKQFEGWDMRRKLHVDFAGDDGSGAGEAVLLLTCGFDEDHPAAVQRFMRHKLHTLEGQELDHSQEEGPMLQKSIFGKPYMSPATSSSNTPRSRSSTPEVDPGQRFQVEWRVSDFTFGALKETQISATATDDSQFAVITTNEDPLLGMSGGSTASSPADSPLPQMPRPSTAFEIPGQRARLLAIGTTTGVILIWNMRASPSDNADIPNTVAPIRTIVTLSPQISSLALTSLYLVHGGNDGLVQAWDPLGSTTETIRTLNSRFSSRARRRLVQVGTTPPGAGHNYFAAGAIVLDPDPTVLRGVVSLGKHLRYWSYSSSSADSYRSGKRRLRRRSERGSNAATNNQRFSSTGRGLLKDYIANEKHELERETLAKRKESERMSGRFGTDLLGPGASEEQMLAYATMLSEESYTSDEVKRHGSGEEVALSSGSSDTVHQRGIQLDGGGPTVPSASFSESTSENDGFDSDVAEAIRLSLLEKDKGPSSSPPALALGSSSRLDRRSGLSSEQQGDVDGDLDFALKLSLAEEQSREASGGVEARGQDSVDEFPVLNSSASGDGARVGKGKGKGKQ